MSVSGPKSGDRITKTSITSMFNEVRDTINDVQVTDLSRGTFGPGHLPSLILDSELKEHTTPGKNLLGPSSANFGEYGWDAPTGWYDLYDGASASATYFPYYRLHNGGSGWTISQDTYLYAFCSVRISTATSDGIPIRDSAPTIPPASATAGTGGFEDHQQVWFNLYHTFNGSQENKRSNNRCVIMQMAPTVSRYTHTTTASPFHPDDITQEQTVTIAYLTRLSSGTLNRIDLMYALNKGGGSVDFDGTDGAVLKHGTMGMFLIPVI